MRWRRVSLKRLALAAKEECHSAGERFASSRTHIPTQLSTNETHRPIKRASLIQVSAWTRQSPPHDFGDDSCARRTCSLTSAMQKSQPDIDRVIARLRAAGLDLSVWRQHMASGGQLWTQPEGQVATTEVSIASLMPPIATQNRLR